MAVDLCAWVKANPVAFSAKVEPDGQWYALAAGPDGSLLWVVEANGSQVVTTTPDGVVIRVADLSAGHPVPTGIALTPEGGIYSGYVATVPFLDGTSRLDHVAADGTVRTGESSLTMVSGRAIAADGTLYAAEMALGDPASASEPPFQLFTGRIVHQTGPDRLEEVADAVLSLMLMERGSRPRRLVVGPYGATVAGLNQAHDEVQDDLIDQSGLTELTRLR